MVGLTIKMPFKETPMLDFAEASTKFQMEYQICCILFHRGVGGLRKVWGGVARLSVRAKCVVANFEITLIFIIYAQGSTAVHSNSCRHTNRYGCNVHVGQCRIMFIDTPTLSELALLLITAK